jgi:hypothetical protein
MNWKNPLLIFLLCLGFGAQAQPDQSLLLKQGGKQFDSALVTKDTARLNVLLQEEFRMKHSNGLKETKSELLQHLSTGYLKYNTIVPDGEAIVDFDGELAYIVRKLKVNGLLNGTPFSIKLEATELWNWHNDLRQWQLRYRESVKIN